MVAGIFFEVPPCSLCPSVVKKNLQITAPLIIFAVEEIILKTATDYGYFA